jgi:hypothetical protein
MKGTLPIDHRASVKGPAIGEVGLELGVKLGLAVLSEREREVSKQPKVLKNEIGWGSGKILEL